MRVHFLGVRGSTPAPGPEFLRYGGDTSSLAVGHDGEPPTLLLDAGTGARRLKGLLGDDPFRGALLLTHLHWDHTHGLPFSRSLDHPDSEVDLYLPAQADGSAADLLARGMSPPHFPIRPEGLRGRWRFHALEPGTAELGGFTVTAVAVPHKGGRTYGYRVAAGGSSLAYVPDHGPAALGPGPDGLGARHPAALELARGVGALVHDSQHTVAEFPPRAHFGHSSIDYAVDLGTRAGARRVVLFHHDPDRTDDELDAIARTWADHPGPQVIVASQCLTLDL